MAPSRESTDPNSGPEVRTRLEPFTTVTERTTLPDELGAIADIAPLHEPGRSSWLLLTERGELVRFDAGSGRGAGVARTTLPAESERSAWNNHSVRRRLHVSARGDFAAVVNDYGQLGEVLDLRSGRRTMPLDGGDYHPETVPFSAAFAEVRGRTVLIHRTSWNRLDVSDPATGELLTERGPTSYQSGQEEPPHYLDFFHGRLHVSPGGRRILDDGWVWHPIGLLTSWSLEPWVLENAWESEDGPSKLDVIARDDWDYAVTWLDDHRLAISGFSDDSDQALPGARIFDASAAAASGPESNDDGRWARELRAFPGPCGALFSDGTWLFCSGPSGLSRWDPETGELTGRMPGYEPTCFHRGAGEFAQIADGALVRVAVRSTRL